MHGVTECSTTPLEISEICRIVREVQNGGGHFHSFQPTREDYLVLFNHPESRTTLALPISNLSAEAVREKIASVHKNAADKPVFLQQAETLRSESSREKHFGSILKVL